MNNLPQNLTQVGQKDTEQKTNTVRLSTPLPSKPCASGLDQHFDNDCIKTQC